MTFHPDAFAESTEAAAYYSAWMPELGKEFIMELRRVVALAALRPDAGSPMRGARRRWVFNRFPFTLVDRVAKDGAVRVLAVAHHRRRPGYWRSRA